MVYYVDVFYMYFCSEDNVKTRLHSAEVIFVTSLQTNRYMPGFVCKPIQYHSIPKVHGSSSKTDGTSPKTSDFGNG